MGGPACLACCMVGAGGFFGCCWLTAWLWAIPLAVVCGALMAGCSVRGMVDWLGFGYLWQEGAVLRFNWYYIVLSPPKWLILPLVTIHLEWGYCRAYLALRIKTLTTKNKYDLQNWNYKL